MEYWRGGQTKVARRNRNQKWTLCRRGERLFSGHQAACLTNLSGFVRHAGEKEAPEQFPPGFWGVFVRALHWRLCRKSRDAQLLSACRPKALQGTPFQVRNVRHFPLRRHFVSPMANGPDFRMRSLHRPQISKDLWAMQASDDVESGALPATAPLRLSARGSV